MEFRVSMKTTHNKYTGQNTVVIINEHFVHDTLAILSTGSEHQQKGSKAESQHCALERFVY